MSAQTNWYKRRNELRPGMIFRDREGYYVQLERDVPGDATKWYVADWCGDHWSFEDGTIEPSDLVELVQRPAEQVSA